jgi:hypothetical protein
MKAWMWLFPSIEEVPSEKLRQHVLKFKDHPALAVWQGLDEIVERFMDFSGLWRTQGIFDTEIDERSIAISLSQEN